MKCLVLVLLVIASQSVTHGVSFEHPQEVAIENQRHFEIANGIAAVITQLAESVKSSLDNLWVDSQNWIHNELVVLQTAIVNGTKALESFLQEVEAEVETLVNEKIEPCFEGVREKLNNTRYETRAGIKACRENGREKLSTIREDVKNYREINQAAIEGVQAYLEACANQTEFNSKIRCALDAARNITDTARAIRENYLNTRAIIAAKVHQAAYETHECIVNELREGRDKIELIIEDVRQCLEEANVNNEETESNEGDEGTDVDSSNEIEAEASDEPTTKRSEPEQYK